MPFSSTEILEEFVEAARTTLDLSAEAEAAVWRRRLMYLADIKVRKAKWKAKNPDYWKRLWLDVEYRSRRTEYIKCWRARPEVVARSKSEEAKARRKLAEVKYRASEKGRAKRLKENAARREKADRIRQNNQHVLWSDTD